MQHPCECCTKHIFKNRLRVFICSKRFAQNSSSQDSMHIRWSAYRYPVSDWQVKHLCRPEVASKPAPKQKTPTGLLSLNTVQSSYLFVFLIRCYVPPHTIYSPSHFSCVNFFVLGLSRRQLYTYRCCEFRYIQHFGQRDLAVEPIVGLR